MKFSGGFIVGMLVMACFAYRKQILHKIKEIYKKIKKFIEQSGYKW